MALRLNVNQDSQDARRRAWQRYLETQKGQANLPMKILWRWGTKLMEVQVEGKEGVLGDKIFWLGDMERQVARHGDMGDKRLEFGTDVGAVASGGAGSPGEEAYIGHAAVVDEPEGDRVEEGRAGEDEAWTLCKSWTSCAISAMCRSLLLALICSCC
ncbi:unnamed protein product [Discosporangium mesarthrocarpum]